MSKRSTSSVTCAECGETYTALTQTIKRTIKRFGKCVCPDCANVQNCLALKTKKEVVYREIGKKEK